MVCNNLGKVSVRAFDDFDKKICALKDAKHWCEVAKFSPCENFLAVGSHDNHCYIYSVDAESHSYSLIAKDHRNSAWINSIDWTADSKELRHSSGDYEILYFNVEAKEPDVHGSEHVADKVWATNSVKYGKDREDIKPHGEDQTHVNDVCATGDNKTMLSGDDFGLVNVFNFPHPDCKAARSYSAHSEHVVRVAFSQDNKLVFSVGGADKALIQWKVKQQ